MIDTANTAMENAHLTKSLRNEIRQYFNTVMVTMNQQDELEQFFLQISPSLKQRV